MPGSAASGDLDLVEVPVSFFDLAATLGSGQAFHWREQGSGFLGLIGDEPVWLDQPAPGLIRCPRGTQALVSHYLGLNADYGALRSSFPKKDRVLAKAVAWSPGLRILEQPKWECLCAFITSSLKQVAHISRMSHTVREKFGTKVRLGPHSLWTWPAPDRLARAGETKLRACGLGYRARSLAETASRVADGSIDLEAFAALDDESLIEALCQCRGVGPKIAHCVALFAYGRMGGFPIDVWIERVLRDWYFPKQPDVSRRELESFARDHFGPNRGFAQQFLFHYARSTLGRGGKSPTPRPD